MGFDAVPAVVRGAAVALLGTLVLLAAGRVLRLPAVSALAGAVGLAAGCLAVTGVVGASPRQLAERLPMLALVALGGAVVVAVLRGRAARAVAGAIGVLAGAWWMSGAPLHPDTMLRAAPVAAALALAMGAGALRGGPAMAVAWAMLAAGLALAAARGPHLAYALAGLGAVLGAALGRQAGAAPVRVALGVMLAGIAAVPVLGRGAPADWAAAAAPALALLAGPWVAGRLPRRIGPWAGPVLAAAPALAATALLR
ncbi:hypothetical protein [Roseomonas fluvialis]|nr:hypothetical protein [Roseomonas fluvialis]